MNVDHDFITTGTDIPCGNPAVDDSFIYWANTGASDTIGRADIDGMNADGDFITGANVACGVAVNSSFIYWANFGNGTIGRCQPRRYGHSNPNFITGTDDPAGWRSTAPSPTGPTAAPPTRSAAPTSTAQESRIRPSSPAGTGPTAGGGRLAHLDPLPAPNQSTNTFSFVGKPQLNKQKGTATLTVEVPGPGTLVLSGDGLRPQSASASGAARAAAEVSAASRVKLKVVSKGKTGRALKRSGKVKVVANVTYTPTGGSSNPELKRIKLIKRR